MKKIIKFSKYIGIVFFLIFIIIVYQKRYFLFPYKPYGVSCKQFMDVGNVKNWKNENSKLLKQVKEKSIYIDFDYITCEGRFGIIINYSSNDIKNKIIRIIGNTDFINQVPYKMNNL